MVEFSFFILSRFLHSSKWCVIQCSQCSLIGVTQSVVIQEYTIAWILNCNGSRWNDDDFAWDERRSKLRQQSNQVLFDVNETRRKKTEHKKRKTVKPGEMKKRKMNRRRKIFTYVMYNGCAAGSYYDIFLWFFVVVLILLLIFNLKPY